MNENYHIRAAEYSDAQAIASIYNHYVRYTVTTFDIEEITDEQMREKMATILTSHPFLVIESNGQLMGYAYAGIWKPRAAYRFTCELSIYLNTQYQGKGLGRRLYNTLIDQLRAQGMKRLIAGIALPNQQSVRFHESMGFEHVGTFRKMGLKFERWVDVGYWERLLD